MLTEERKKILIENLRGHSIRKENISEEYKKNLLLADRREYTFAPGGKAYIFTAKNREKHCPVHINLHGGGFVRPHELRDEIWSARVADAIRGIAVDVDYALAPEHLYPTAFHETYELIRQVFALTGEWNADPSRITAGGHSAGANLVAAVCLKANQTKDFRIRMMVLNYGIFDMAEDPSVKPGAATNSIPIERGRMFTEAYLGGDLTLASEIYCSPLLASDEELRGMPDALVLSAGRDSFRYEDAEFAKRLSLNGAGVIAKCFLNSDHGFLIHCSDEWEEAQQLILKTLTALS